MISPSYKAVGQCIYCGKKPPKVELSVEHIVADGLCGNLLLPDSSCTSYPGSCSEITGRFEGRFMQQGYDGLRTFHGIFGNRRKKSRRTEIPLDISSEQGPFVRLGYLSPNEHPFISVFLIFDRARILTGRPHPENIDMRATLHNGDQLSRYGKVKSPGVQDIEPVVRTLAKIAHAYAVAEYGLGSFQPFLLDLIRNDKFSDIESNWSRFVGCSDITNDSPSPNLHEVELRPLVQNGRFFLICWIRLFSCAYNSPTYEVVVGEHWNAAFASKTASIQRR
jgi:hypothetical protein